MIKLFVSSLAFYTTLSHPHPGWIYVGTPAPTMPGGITIPNPNAIPPMTHPNNPPVIPPQGVPPQIGIPSPPLPVPNPNTPNTPNTTPGSWTATTTTTAKPATNLTPVQPIIPPPATTTTSGHHQSSTTPPIAPIAQITTLTPGTNTISTTTEPVTVPGTGITPGQVPPVFPPVATPPAFNPAPGTGTIPGLPFFETTSTGAPANTANTASGAGPASTISTASGTGTGTGPGTGTGNGPSIVPPPWIGTLGPGQIPVIPIPGLTPQPTPYPTRAPTTVTQTPTAAPVIPTQRPTTPNPTTPYPTTPAPVPPLPGHQYGSWGQNCPLPLGTELCTDITDIVTDQSGNNAIAGELQCSAANDCCLCESIHCGSVGGNSCTALTLSGQKAAYGVQDINVVVDPASGTPASIACSGLESCKKSSIRGNFISQMSCIGRFGCQASEITINNPSPGFSLECGVTSACEYSRITLNFLPPAGGCDPNAVTDVILGSISCVGVNGCRGMEFTINNMGCDNVILDSIECRQDTCADARFNFYGTSPIGIQSCELPANGAQPAGIERCFSQLRSLSCPDPGSCMNQQRTLIDPINGFMLSCESEQSCLNAQYTIQITPTQFTTPTEQITVQCNAPQSCQNARFDFTNDNVTPLYVEAGCNAERSCAGTTFTTGPNVFLFDVDCGSPELCYGCTLNGVPCGGHYGLLPPQYSGPPQFPPITNPTIPNIPPNPNNNFPLFPNPNTNPVAIPVFPSVPSPPLSDPWAQPNPWSSGPSFNSNPNPSIPTFTNPNPNPVPVHPLPSIPSPQPAPIDPWIANPPQPAPIDPWIQPNPIDPWAQPQPNPIDPFAPPFSNVPNPNPVFPDPWANPNPVVVPSVPSPPNQPSIPTFNQPAAPAPPQNPAPATIPPPQWPVIVDPWTQPNPVQPAPIDPWAQPQPNPNPNTVPVDPWAVNPQQPAPVDPWAQPQPPFYDPFAPNPFFDPFATPFYNNQPNQQGPSFSFGQPVNTFPQNPGPWIV